MNGPEPAVHLQEKDRFERDGIHLPTSLGEDWGSNTPHPLDLGSEPRMKSAFK